MSFISRFAKSAAAARVSAQMVNILMPKCRAGQLRSVKLQVRDYYESGGFDEITVNRDSNLKVKELRTLLLLGLENKIIGPVTTSGLVGVSVGTISGAMLFRDVWHSVFLISVLGFLCWVDSL
jgi:hypothetical protein